MYINSMDELKNQAIEIKEGTEISYPLCGKTEKLNHNWISVSYTQRYAYNGGVISFIDEKMCWYVIPCLEGIQKLLEKNGYIRAEFFVPFSSLCSYPVKEKDRWEAMLEKMRNQQ